MERSEVDEDDRPKTEISITGVTIFVNPYKEMEEAEKNAEEEQELKVNAFDTSELPKICFLWIHSILSSSLNEHIQHSLWYKCLSSLKAYWMNCPDKIKQAR